VCRRPIRPPGAPNFPGWNTPKAWLINSPAAPDRPGTPVPHHLINQHYKTPGQPLVRRQFVNSENVSESSHRSVDCFVYVSFIAVLIFCLGYLLLIGLPPGVFLILPSCMQPFCRTLSGTLDLLVSICSPSPLNRTPASTCSTLPAPDPSQAVTHLPLDQISTPISKPINTPILGYFPVNSSPCFLHLGLQSNLNTNLLPRSLVSSPALE